MIVILRRSAAAKDFLFDEEFPSFAHEEGQASSVREVNKHNDAEVVWPMLKGVRREPDMLEGMMRAATVVQHHLRKSKRELKKLLQDGEVVPPWLKLMMNVRVETAEKAWTVEQQGVDGRSDDLCACVNTKDPLMCADVDLMALKEGRRHEACSLHCLTHAEGLCIHLLTGYAGLKWLGAAQASWFTFFRLQSNFHISRYPYRAYSKRRQTSYENSAP